MRYRQLGASQLTVSEISLGTWLTFGVGVETATARACLELDESTLAAIDDAVAGAVER